MGRSERQRNEMNVIALLEGATAQREADRWLTGDAVRPSHLSEKVPSM